MKESDDQHRAHSIFLICEPTRQFADENIDKKKRDLAREII